MSTTTFETDDERVASLGSHISLKRVEDIVPDEDYVLSGSRWWRVMEMTSIQGSQDVRVDLELGGPPYVRPAQEEVARAPWGTLMVVADPSAGLQFRDGNLLDVPWPVGDLIHVKDSARWSTKSQVTERVTGVFSRHHAADGGPDYYAPVDPEFQPGMPASAILDPRFDLILDWEPVDVGDLLERLESSHGEI